MEAISVADAHEFPVYPKRPVTLVRGEGARVWDDAGREYIDCATGVGVASLGHCHPAIVEAVGQQANRLITCAGTFHNDARSELYSRLAEIAPPSLTRFFLCNSGTEAIEAAIKFARATTGRTEFVSAARGFHGRTCGSLSATHNPKHRKNFEPLVPGFGFVPLNDIERLEEAVTEKTAAVILEVIQGEGGVRLADTGFLRASREICTRRGALLIIDEVQTGFCRTGQMFAVMHHDLQPDILCVAKAMAGGLPMGAVMCSEAIPGLVGHHGSTFGGNPLCCAAAVAAIDTMRQNRLDEQAAAKGEHLRAALSGADLPRVREVRGLGLMIGIELKEKVTPILRQLMDEGVIALPAGQTVLRLLPPLIIEQTELDQVIGVLRRTLA